MTEQQRRAAHYGARLRTPQHVRRAQEKQINTLRDTLRRALPMLITLGDYIGNGPIDAARPGSLGTRCDLIGDIHDLLEPDAARRPLRDIGSNPIKHAGRS